MPLSVLDLAVIGRDATARDALEGTVTMARLAEARGYRRVWYAEHHNMASIASSATSVVIAHVAAHTERIRVGAGGIMLPNHSPLTVAEQFGTLATLHPGRIDLGLGRAPGSDQATTVALRRPPEAAESFPRDVVELQGYLAGASRVPGVEAVPGAGTDVPIYVLGSSLFGAELAAVLGLPYGFASHFAPAALHDAVALYRDRFQPSAQLEHPYVLAGVNVIAAPTDDEAADERRRVTRSRVAAFLAPRRDLTDAELDRLVDSPQGRGVVRMMTHTAAGTPGAVRDHLDRFTAEAGADELMVVFASPTLEGRLRSAALLADAAGLEPAA